MLEIREKEHCKVTYKLH